MRIVTWNVNGLRASLKKGFEDIFSEFDADIFCVQETKMQQGQQEIPADGYTKYWDNAEKKGYSGTLVFTKEEPISNRVGLGIDEHDTEGRLVTLEYPDC